MSVSTMPEAEAPSDGSRALVVDADSHVMEPMSAWDGLPEAYRPRIEKNDLGLDQVYVGDTLLVIVSLGLLGTPGSKMSDFEHAKPLEEALPGGFDPRIRLSDMDSEGIDVAVFYPSVGLNFWAIEDPSAAV